MTGFKIGKGLLGITACILNHAVGISLSGSKNFFCFIRLLVNYGLNIRKKAGSVADQMIFFKDYSITLVLVPGKIH